MGVREKQREQLKSFKHRGDISNRSTSRTKAASILTIAGAVTGLAISWLATDASSMWMIIAALIGAAIGYFLGRFMDRDQ